MYKIVESVNNEMRITTSITEEELNELKKFSEPIWEIDGKIRFFDLIKEEYDEYISVIKDQKSTTTKVVRAINNYLSSYKAFLDRWETFFKRHGSQELIDYFKISVSEVYDKCFEYRFIYNLRNYAQHAGIPISRISNALDKDIEISIKKETFINSHSGMQPKFKKELRQLQCEEIDIDNAIKVVHKELEKIHNKFIGKFIESIEDCLYSANYIREFHKKYNKYSGELSVISQGSVDEMVAMSKEPGTTTINPYPVHSKMALFILSSAKIVFRFKGKLIGKSQGFPELLKLKNVLEMPNFTSGRRHVEYQKITWVKIEEATGFEWRDGYDRLFTIYMPAGLEDKFYKKMINSLEQERDKMFPEYSSHSK
ncbi:hypothetical protein EXW28_02925 [Bacillus mycoides]|uniref:hypothetical protein n=1 Tax=Bacillus mycoides TaxID=1405 RepID=UPI001C011A9E|nr:hypothetical protein [Bacillus mycoides]QWG48869.1 hypothetical protein EXW37_02925 [Bacillus mycoides]QWH32675.1 hypothetical protein EXW28_02925 [Bacillus mycoides]